MKVYIREFVAYYHKKSCKALLWYTDREKSTHIKNGSLEDIIRDGKRYPPCPVCFREELNKK